MENDPADRKPQWRVRGESACMDLESFTDLEYCPRHLFGYCLAIPEFIPRCHVSRNFQPLGVTATGLLRPRTHRAAGLEV